MSVEALWFSDTLWAQGARALLAPASWLFGAASGARTALYNRGTLRVVPSPIPVISVGNVSVGGTGKTPFASWLAHELQCYGAHPAIVMRGYGDDEPRVHQILSPGVPVYTGADRVSSIAQARAHGSDVVVLDDGFQHRRAGRAADIVLVSADAWPASNTLRLLPAGPFREPLHALRRARLAIVTSKTASPDTIAHVVRAIHAAAPLLPIACVHFAFGELVEAIPSDGVTPRRLPLSVLSGASVFAIAAIGEPRPFFAQLRAQGATVVERSFRDHHPFSRSEIRTLAAESDGHKYTISTLKDAVKLASEWPAKDRTLWYVSQAVEVNDGQSFIDTLLADILSQRRP